MHQDEEKARDELRYDGPEITDLGDLTQVTQATAFTGAEDGGSKALIHHSSPQVP